MDFGVEISKSKSRFGIRILGILGAPIFRQNGKLEFLGPNLPKMDFGVGISKI